MTPRDVHELCDVAYRGVVCFTGEDFVLLCGHITRWR